MANPYIYEFLYRGNADGSEAWHLIQAAESTDPFGAPTRSEKVYTIAEAEAAGLSLPTIIASINASTLKDLEAVKAERDSLKDQLGEAQAQIASAIQAPEPAPSS